MLSSLEIAQAAVMRPITDVAAEYGIEPDELELYGRYKAKVDLSILERLAGTPDAKLINVTAITPTPAGEGKTTTAVALAQGFGKVGRRAVLALREPSLGPVFGVKGGAAGGGYAQVVPMEDINLHFTGDFHAITSAHNLLAAMIELLPWAMFANGPACMKQIWPSSVCTMFGLIASLSRTAIAPAAWTSSAVTGSPAGV